VSKIEVGRFSSLLRRVLNMKGVSDVSSELSPEISPVLTLESERPEWEFLKGQKLMSVVFAGRSVAGQNSAIRLRNPVDSGVVAVFPAGGIIVGITLNTSVILLERNTIQAALAEVIPSVARDTRYPQLAASALLASQGNNIAASGEAYWSIFLDDKAQTTVDVPFVLTPGFQLQLSSTSNALVLRGAFGWLERRLDQMERD